jgi:hypothetical protein
MIEDGHHLQQCLRYIDLNMVRAGRVRHPREWKWSGYHELMGQRQRYRLLAIDELLRKIGAASFQEFQAHYSHGIEERLARRELQRDAKWTRSVAVGSRAYVEAVRPRVRHNGALEIEQEVESSTSQSAGATWVLRETGPAPTWRTETLPTRTLGADLRVENGPSGLFPAPEFPQCTPDQKLNAVRPQTYQ